jgi:hypothetical protein
MSYRIDRKEDVKILGAVSVTALNTAIATEFATGHLPIGPVWANADNDEFSICVAVPSFRMKKKSAYTAVGVVTATDTTDIRTEINSFTSGKAFEVLFQGNHNGDTFIVLGVLVA